MIIVFTGDGKGKTTAALGQALRAVGDRRQVLMIQFIKGPWRSGEDDAQLLLRPHLHIRKRGLGFVGILGDRLPRTEHVAAAEEALAHARGELHTGSWNLIILDEINNALHLNLISLPDVLALLDEVPHGTDLILTGRDARPEIIDRADIVTEMREMKHPYQEGETGTKGIEW
jgi:cob(I)alamin adenosyltransferase